MRNAQARLLAGCAAGVLALAACSTNSPSQSSAAAKGDGKDYKIALLLPETAVPRYDGKDKPYFKAELKKLCASCTLLYANANASADTQQQQAQSMLTQGADVLVVDPVDGVAAASIVTAAKAKNVPVVAYDRLIKSPELSYVVSNDYEQVGKLQAQALVDKLNAGKVSPSEGGIIMMNGAGTDNNAASIKAGALSVINKSGYKVLSSTDTWEPAAAQSWASGQITRFGTKIVGVYSANDGNAGGAIAALKAAGVAPMPPITGLDATLSGLQAILVGNQYMTTYNSFQKEAETAAAVAYDLARGVPPQAPATVDGHPATLNPPVAVTASTIESIVIRDGFWSVSQLCTSAYNAACAEQGIK
ncbi:substrate-binding domain-containing protein (plasmid) [Embleya sp. NBC_00888]|uniref:substrate-binding domain-containing protein n=1 Tax=Embleya sp. NBC_00888 TaxID=2975960 RepID=UPI002F907A0B|nr:substrate-binding domain-containing protein [Embleya sp. NBC_00888]